MSWLISLSMVPSLSAPIEDSSPMERWIPYTIECVQQINKFSIVLQMQWTQSTVTHQPMRIIVCYLGQLLSLSNQLHCWYDRGIREGVY